MTPLTFNFINKIAIETLSHECNTTRGEQQAITLELLIKVIVAELRKNDLTELSQEGIEQLAMRCYVYSKQQRKGDPLVIRFEDEIKEIIGYQKRETEFLVSKTINSEDVKEMIEEGISLEDILEMECFGHYSKVVENKARKLIVAYFENKVL